MPWRRETRTTRGQGLETKEAGHVQKLISLSLATERFTCSMNAHVSFYMYNNTYMWSHLCFSSPSSSPQMMDAEMLLPLTPPPIPSFLNESQSSSRLLCSEVRNFSLLLRSSLLYLMIYGHIFHTGSWGWGLLLCFLVIFPEVCVLNVCRSFRRSRLTSG